MHLTSPVFEELVKRDERVIYPVYNRMINLVDAQMPKQLKQAVTIKDGRFHINTATLPDSECTQCGTHHGWETWTLLPPVKGEQVVLIHFVYDEENGERWQIEHTGVRNDSGLICDAYMVPLDS